MNRVRVGVLASGSGSNLAALMTAAADPSYPAEIAVVLSNRQDAYALERARRAGIAAVHVGRQPGAEARDPAENRAVYDAACVAVLQEYRVEWVCLAGYLRLVTRTFLDAFPWRILNIHPSLLPAFPGLDAQAQALAAGVRIAGCTVHLVDEGTDTGPIIGQGAVVVREGETLDSLRERILGVEHALYPQALRWAAEGRIQVDAGRVRLVLPPGEQPVMGVLG